MHVFAEMESKNPCAQGSVVNVKAMRYCVRLNLTGVDRGEDGCPDWEDIADEQFPATIKVITQVNRLNRRAHMWHSFLIHAMELQSPVVKTIRLVSTYRFYPEITKCLGKAIYEPSLIPNTATLREDSLLEPQDFHFRIENRPYSFFTWTMAT